MKAHDEQSDANVFDLFCLRGKLAIVTGATGHLGRALASALADAGTRVVTTSRDADRAMAIATELPNYEVAGHFGVQLDHTDPQSISTLIEEINRQAGQIDVLVNNAHEATDQDWQSINGEQFQAQLANLTGYFLLARQVRNLAVERRHGASIVLLGSMYGVVGSYPDAYENLVTASPAAYHALKGGIVHLTRHLAVYWAKDNVRVNCLSPGPFPSAKASSQMVERLIAKSPMRRMGAPHELKGAILLLASDAGSYITGQNLIVDGGWTAW
jgi:NAD(P)-dependent dehydrogenase (short-subunit alcohol dehydrogenase family)